MISLHVHMTLLETVFVSEFSGHLRVQCCVRNVYLRKALHLHCDFYLQSMYLSKYKSQYT